MTTKTLAAAALDAKLVDEMMKGRGRILGAVGGMAIAFVILSAMAFVLKMGAARPHTAYEVSPFLFLMGVGMLTWSLVEYRSLRDIDRRREEATSLEA